MRFAGLNPGIAAALSAAALFGASAPYAKVLLASMSPSLLAALLYLGSGLGLLALRTVRREPSVSLPKAEWRWLAAAILCGGIVAPVLLLIGLTRVSAASASLLLNAEAVFTALLAWFVFKENFDRRIAFGMLAIVLGALVLSWPAQASASFIDFSAWLPSLAILGACFCWGLDNNFTRKVSLNDATWITMTKGLVAGTSNLLIALFVGSIWPGFSLALSAALLGFLSYGVSLTLFVIALRHLGTARTGAYFGVSSFFGALLAIVAFGESVTTQLAIGGALMLLGVALHLSERHSHEHSHEEMHHEHEHEHIHGVNDPHHEHEHTPPVAPGTRHSHRHFHPALRHTHEHYPDAHHTHSH
jgi:drug/metabolite transporter (DMT)-like permease